MDVDSESDILGGPSLEIGPSGGNGWLFNTTVVALVCGLGWLAWHGRARYLQMTEIRYKKAMRRRHGIPDEDQRPFNVAYAAAMRARGREDEGSSAPGGSDKRLRNALAEGQEGLRQRFSDVAPQATTSSVRQDTQAYAPPQITQSRSQNHLYETTTQTDPLDFDARYKPIYPELYVTGPDSDTAHSRPIPVSRQHSKLSNLPAHIRKRSFDEEEDEIEPLKKSRVEGEEFIDGDDDAAWAYQRGAKRGVTDEDDEGYESNRGDKRPRNMSRDKTPEDHIMEEDEMDADELADLQTISRGKKRDRAEAGSTFGGDDEDHTEEGKVSRRHKRKMLSKRKSDAYMQSRGRKRDMEESDEEETGQGYQGTRRKRGKKAEEDDGEGSDTSMNESLVSRGSYTKGRKIGDEWAVNGVLYKVGPNRQRLRQALVKKARNRFPMPKDSQHPDRQANLEVFVETWLTEDQFKEAKDRHELAWQDTPKPSAEPETPGDVQDSPSMKGKDLLWSKAAAQESPLATRRPFRQSIATNMGLRINAFPETQSASGRRISSAYSPAPSGAPLESPSRKSGFRTFSKWEKQDLEAEAMAKMRAKLQEQKKSAPSDVKSMGLGAPPLTSSISAPGSANFASTPGLFAKPADKLVPAPSAPAISFSVPNTTGSTATSKPPLFSTPSAPASSQPAVSFGKPPAAATNGTSSSLSFPAMAAPQTDPAKPPMATPSPSLNVPNFFAPKPSPAPTPALAPAPSPQPAAPAAAFGMKPPTNAATSAPSFSFGNPASKPAAPPASSQVVQPAAGPSSTFGGAKPTVFGGSQPSTMSNVNGLGSFNAPPANGSSTFGAKVPTMNNSMGAPSPFGASASTTLMGSPFSADKGKPEAPKSTSVFGSSGTANANSAKPPSVFGSTQPTSAFGSSATSTTPAFGSGNSQTSNTFGSSATSTTPAFGSGNSQASSPAPPKFSFGVSKAPSASPAPAPEAPKPQASSFGFGNTAPAPKPAETAEATSAPKFKFSVPGGASPAFGSTSALSSASTAAPKSGFGGFANGASAGNPFSAAPTAKSPISFGSGASTTSASEAPKPSFAFGSSATTAPAPAAPASNSTPSFAFGGASPFGAAAVNNTANGAAQSAFGQTSTSTPSAFGFGNTSNSFSFGGKK